VIVLDTNVVSELMKAEPAPQVATWVRSHSAPELFTTAITFAEIGYGIARLPGGRRKNLLEAAAEVLFTAFAEQVLPFDKSAAGRYGQIVNHRERAGRPLNGFDAQIAAICQARHADLATRNLKDFEGMELSLINPWQS